MPAGASFGKVRARAALYEPLRRLPQITRMSRFPSAMSPPDQHAAPGIVMEWRKPPEQAETCELVMPGPCPARGAARASANWTWHYDARCTADAGPRFFRAAANRGPGSAQQH